MPAKTPCTWADHLQAAWLQRGALTGWLRPLAGLYHLLWRLRTWLYRSGIKTSQRLPVTVVVVGNVVVGGSGKTPTVIELVRHLQSRGWRPGVVSRGHGRQGRAPQRVSAHTSASDVGDEPLLIAQRTQAPVVVGRQRVAAAQFLLAQCPEVNLIISDDGMQHWALARDLTLVVFDGRGVGNGLLLPAGMLRQPWPEAPLGSEPLLLLQTAPGPSMACAHWPLFQAQRALANSAHNAQAVERSLSDFLTEPSLGALAGIAQPQAFFSMLTQAGLPLRQTLALPDHADAATLRAHMRQHPHITTWLCTEKDATKLHSSADAHTAQINNIWAVPLQLTLPAALYQSIERHLPPPPAQAVSSPHGHPPA